MLFIPAKTNEGDTVKSPHPKVVRVLLVAPCCLPGQLPAPVLLVYLFIVYLYSHIYEIPVGDFTLLLYFL